MNARNLVKRIAIGMGITLLVIIIVLVLLFFNEIKTLTSLKKIDNHPFYSMTYSGDYGFDDFLKVGAKSDKDIERFVMKRLLKGIEIDFNISSAGCTAFTATNESGERIYARNFDFDYAPSLLLYTKPSNGYSSVSIVNLSYAGYTADYLPEPMTFSSFLTLAGPYLPFDGMNECGVTMALLAVPYAEPPAKADQITLNTTTAIRLVLDKAANVHEAVDLLKKYNYYFSGKVDCHYLIADSSGKSVVVEFLDKDVKVIENSKNYQIASNFIMFNGLNIGEGYDEFERYEKAEKALEENSGVLSEEQAMKVLSEVMIPDRTQWSVVYNMTSKGANVCINKKYENKYKFNLGDLGKLF